MRARSRPDDRVAEAAQRRLEALAAELGGRPTVRATTATAGPGEADDGPDEAEWEGDEDTTMEEEPELLGRHARRPLPAPRRAASWTGDRLPATFAGLRVGVRHVAVLSVV